MQGKDVTSEIDRITKINWKFIDNDLFHEQGVEAALFPLPELDFNKISETWNQIFLGRMNSRAEGKHREALEDEVQTRFFLALNYAKYRLHLLVAQTEAQGHVNGEAPELIKWANLVWAIRHRLVIYNLGLVIEIMRRIGCLGRSDSHELIGEGYYHLLRAVDRFDASKGYKFSTYSWRIIKKGIVQSLVALNKRRDKEMETDGTEYELAAPKDNQEVEELINSLKAGLNHLTDDERFFVERKFFEGESDREIGNALEVSRGTAGKIGQSALSKLSEVLNIDVAV